MSRSRKGSTASISSGTSSKARDMRRQRNKGKIRAGSPGEEMALVEHLKGMSLVAGAKCELKSLLLSLLMLGKEDIARKLQRIGENYQLSQISAVKLAEDAMSSDRRFSLGNLKYCFHRNRYHFLLALWLCVLRPVADI
ncbi:unnamed protein product [Ilex paraguariensis]|uniref:ELP1 three-helical bundle domain-containing protein n=1 Tax=Ilex paraguariensis TaxID=185542 RepID=A0ABC8T3D6_9AQUA